MNLYGDFTKPNIEWPVPLTLLECRNHCALPCRVSIRLYSGDLVASIGREMKTGLIPQFLLFSLSQVGFICSTRPKNLCIYTFRVDLYSVDLYSKCWLVLNNRLTINRTYCLQHASIDEWIACHIIYLSQHYTQQSVFYRLDQM